MLISSQAKDGTKTVRRPEALSIFHGKKGTCWESRSKGDRNKEVDVSKISPMLSNILIDKYLVNGMSIGK